VFSKGRWSLVHRRSQGISVDNSAHDHGVHLSRLRAVDRLADHAFHARPSGQTRARDLLDVPCARAVDVRVQRPRRRAPMLGRKTRETPRLLQRCPLQQDFLVTTPTDLCSACTRRVIERLPPPPWFVLLADTTPHGIPRGFTGALHGPNPCSTGQRAAQGRVDRRESRVLLPAHTQPRVRTAPQHPRRLAHPTRMQTHGYERVLHRRHAPAVTVVEQHTACGTRGVLAQGALGPTGCCAACDALLAVTVRTVDGDQGPGALRALGGCQEETQCTIHCSPSPL
jgi:hypothetical protein